MTNSQGTGNYTLTAAENDAVICVVSELLVLEEMATYGSGRAQSCSQIREPTALEQVVGGSIETFVDEVASFQDAGGSWRLPTEGATLLAGAMIRAMNSTIEISIEATSTQSPDEISTLAREYFSSFKYVEQTAGVPKQLRFAKSRRGLGFNPLDWASTLTVKINTSDNGTSDVAIAAIIDTTGQTVFDKEEEKWREFIINFKRTLAGEELADLGDIQQQANRQVSRFFLRVIPRYAMVALTPLAVLAILLMLLHLI